jgi:hypothetical protein
VGRKQTIFIDKIELLRGIAAEEKEQTDLLKSQIKEVEGYHSQYYSSEFQQAHRELRFLKDWGIRCVVANFFERELSPSETIRAQKAVRELEADGYIEIIGLRAAWVRMLPAGWKALKAKPEAVK